MGKLVPIFLLLIGTGAGCGAGVFLAPEPVECPDPAQIAEDEDSGEEADVLPVEFVRLNDQIVVPVLSDGNV